ncbi:MAG: hypothetical protein JRG95_09280 [Deltaproteobacteria bacterium]|nr:hypothetical protein [Deltaproteobacteria bacterium]
MKKLIPTGSVMWRVVQPACRPRVSSRVAAEPAKKSRYLKVKRMPRLLLVFGSLDAQRGEVVDRRGEQDQAQETPIPSPIEEVARGQQSGLVAAVATAGPGHREHDGEEDEEGRFDEQHGGGPTFSESALHRRGEGRDPRVSPGFE